jgi:hypothetical protein
MAGVGKKHTLMASREFSFAFDDLSKQALIDVLWCACQSRTDDSPEQIFARASREAVLALRERGDRVPKTIRIASQVAETVYQGQF